MAWKMTGYGVQIWKFMLLHHFGKLMKIVCPQGCQQLLCPLGVFHFKLFYVSRCHYDVIIGIFPIIHPSYQNHKHTLPFNFTIFIHIASYFNSWYFPNIEGSNTLSNHVHFGSNQFFKTEIKFSNHKSVLKTRISFQIIKSVLKTQISSQICQIRFSNHKAVLKSLNTPNIN